MEMAREKLNILKTLAWTGDKVEWQTFVNTIMNFRGKTIIVTKINISERKGGVAQHSDVFVVEVRLRMFLSVSL
jgi:hypothetical protein